MNEELEWMDPPDDGRGGNQRSETRWSKVAKQLAVFPGKWARIAHDVPDATGSRLKKSPAFQPPENWEIVTRRVRSNGKRVDVYARRV